MDVYLDICVLAFQNPEGEGREAEQGYAVSVSSPEKNKDMVQLK